MITLSDQGPIGGHATELLGESYDPKLIYYLNMAIGISLVFWMKFFVLLWWVLAICASSWASKVYIYEKGLLSGS